MKKFWGYAFNDKFSVGCTGQTVYLFDDNGNEISRFKDITYGYTPVISPDGKLLVVKSTGGKLAVYSLESRTLMKKFRFSKVDGAQNDGFCFSSDGKLFINIERQKDDLHSAISVYNSADFSLISQVLLGDDMMARCIEFDQNTDAYYILGFMRDNYSLVMRHGFVAKFENYEIKNITAVSDNEYELYYWYKHMELMGFTEKAYEWLPEAIELETLKAMKLTLAELYFKYNK